ncbi:beta-ketoacyl synthase N-terminal-like domain-containing protein, partial [Streptomyces collinus]
MRSAPTAAGPRRAARPREAAAGAGPPTTRGLAANALRAGETDIALCGGVNALHHPRIPVMF